MKGLDDPVLAEACGKFAGCYLKPLPRPLVTPTDKPVSHCPRKRLCREMLRYRCTNRRSGQ